MTTKVGDLLDSAFLCRLIEILKTPSLNLQRKAASILEYVTAEETLIEKIISVDIASGLDAIFRQGSLKGKIIDDLFVGFAEYIMMIFAFYLILNDCNFRSQMQYFAILLVETL